MASAAGRCAAIALIVMMVPILARVSPEALVALFRQKGLWKHILFSFVANWIVLPLFMFCLAWAFLPDKGESALDIVFFSSVTDAAFVAATQRTFERD